ncbi:hypothetical protein [Streptomyces microflavus]|uniref:hypothetical protein n=1 Tax=Streptomyces microflavus TaxID=1919 RepID=UPI003868E813|nr:hypothetical protein OG721_04220 [Streptomyces microflavus]
MDKLLVGSALLSAAGAVTAIQHNYAVCSVALFAVASGGIGAYLISRYQDAANDRAVLHRLRASPHQPVDVLASELGLRPAAVRLSIYRLTSSGELRPNAGSSE